MQTKDSDWTFSNLSRCANQLPHLLIETLLRKAKDAVAGFLVLGVIAAVTTDAIDVPDHVDDTAKIALGQFAQPVGFKSLALNVLLLPGGAGNFLQRSHHVVLRHVERVDVHMPVGCLGWLQQRVLHGQADRRHRCCRPVVAAAVEQRGLAVGDVEAHETRSDTPGHQSRQHERLFKLLSKRRK